MDISLALLYYLLVLRYFYRTLLIVLPPRFIEPTRSQFPSSTPFEQEDKKYEVQPVSSAYYSMERSMLTLKVICAAQSYVAVPASTATARWGAGVVP